MRFVNESLPPEHDFPHKRCFHDRFGLGTLLQLTVSHP